MKERACRNTNANICRQFPTEKPAALTNIGLIGCCEEHDEWYVEYRTLSWPEFGNEILNKGLDSTDFVGIQLPAFYYFAPGILWAITKSIIRHNEIPSHLWEWLYGFENHSRKINYILKERVNAFTLEQKTIVVKCLELADEIHEVQEGYRKREIEWALTKLWPHNSYCTGMPSPPSGADDRAETRGECGAPFS